MVRVVDVANAPSIVVEHDGVRSQIVLSGIEITDPANAIAFLTWSLQSSWVMIENGQVYRSPDGMLINAELVRKGYARGLTSADHVQTIYLGELDLGVREKPKATTTSKPPVPRAKAVTRLIVRRRPIRSRTTRVLLR